MGSGPDISEAPLQTAPASWGDSFRPAPTSRGDREPVFSTFLRANLVVWLGFTVFSTLARVVFFQSLTAGLLLTTLLDPIGFAYTCALHLLYRRLIAAPVRPATAVLVVIVCSLSGGFLQTILMELIKSQTAIISVPVDAAGGRPITIIFYTTTFVGWSIGYFWIATHLAMRTERLRRMEAEAAALRAELHELQMQLDPHFLFNALNTIAVEIQDRPKVALDMTRSVATYLRDNLEQGGTPLCPLEEELDLVRAYLKIQALRFDDRLDIDLDVDSDTLSVRVPRLLLQGLVENAIKHGRKAENGRYLVRVTARREGNALTLQVVNHGRYRPAARPGRGLGIENTRRRLEIHYPDRHLLTIGQDGDTVTARLILEGAPCYA